MTTPFRVAIADQLQAGFASTHAGLLIRSDRNVAFTPPSDAAWLDVSFVDGAEDLAAVGAAGGRLYRQPLLVYVDAYTPLNSGDALATELVERAKALLRYRSIEGARWERFEAGPEGESRGEYRKQLVAIFRRSLRV